MTYRELDELSGQVRNLLGRLKAGRGARVGIAVRKSINAVAAIYGTLRAGAAYVPVDPATPAERAAYILADCGVAAVFVEEGADAGIAAQLRALGAAPHLVVVPTADGGRGLRDALARAEHADGAGPAAGEAPGPDDLAYVLYTSGSTGRPKGVMLSHRNAMNFVWWCVDTFQPTPEDRFSSHAPLTFDLSILDLYTPLAPGATVLLIGAEEGKEPQGLAALIAGRRLTIWYSAPSILSALVQFGKLDRHDFGALRLVLFAGEVFPVKYLHALMAKLRGPRYFNLYGPTETNVCTFFQIPQPPEEERTQPYPIGVPCSHYAALVVDELGAAVARGAEGELCIAGPGVTQGYWNLPEQSARAFLGTPDGRRWYRTGDVVVEDGDGSLVFVGRRDRMVKRRGYRIELAEIEAGLYRHAQVTEAAAVAVADGEGGVRILAFVGCPGEAQPSIIALKQHCADVLPLYMVPDRFLVRTALPKTSTDKIDYQRLLAEVR